MRQPDAKHGNVNIRLKVQFTIMATTDSDSSRPIAKSIEQTTVDWDISDSIHDVDDDHPGHATVPPCITKDGP